jgi:hypothetical protein
MRPIPRQIDKAVDLAKGVITRDMTLNAECVQQRLLITHRSPIIGRISLDKS